MPWGYHRKKEDSHETLAWVLAAAAPAAAQGKDRSALRHPDPNDPLVYQRGVRNFEWPLGFARGKLYVQGVRRAAPDS